MISGIWHYYDSDDNMVTSEWRKDGTSWFYLDDDGDMLTMSWVDDESYVNERGKSLSIPGLRFRPTTASMIPVKTVITGIILTAKAAS